MVVAWQPGVPWFASILTQTLDACVFTWPFSHKDTSHIGLQAHSTLVLVFIFKLKKKFKLWLKSIKFAILPAFKYIVQQC